MNESDIIPFHSSPPAGERVIVLAPHPDDESLGCGGAISLLVKSGKQVKVVFLTSGDKADPDNKLSNIVVDETDIMSPRLRKKNKNVAFPLWKRGMEGDFKDIHKISPNPSLPKRGVPGTMTNRVGAALSAHITAYSFMREEEAKKALNVLGVSDYDFLRFPDRGLYDNYKDALESLMNIAGDYKPDTIYAPSMVELNPDHRAAAALALEVQRISMKTDASGAGHALTLLFYEVTMPLRPNILVDISTVYKRKKKAIEKHRSQMRLRDYLNYITAMNVFRALTVAGSKYVEAFWRIDKPVSGEDIAKWLSFSTGLD